MQYAFDMDLAQRYGVPEAIFVHRLYWWVRDNAANGRNYRDGRYWTYDSLNALTKIFPGGHVGSCKASFPVAGKRV